MVELDMDDIETMTQLRLFRRQHPELPEALRPIMSALAGKPTWRQLQQQKSPLHQLCQDTLEMRMQQRFTVYRGDTLKFQRLPVPLRYQVAMLRTACLRKVRIEILRASQAKGDTAQGAGEEMQTSGHPQPACAGASEHARTAALGAKKRSEEVPWGQEGRRQLEHLWRTPRNERELAVMIRDADGNLQCPYGFDFASFTLAAASTSSNIKDA